MNGVLIHISPESPSIAASIRAHMAGEDEGRVYPARTIAHVRIDGLHLTMTVEQVEKLHARLGAALAQHRDSPKAGTEKGDESNG